MEIEFCSICRGDVIKLGKSDNFVKPKVTNINSGSLYPENEINHQKQLNDLKGKTLEVYYYLVEKDTESGVREVQRDLGYASPSIASYHLNRLLEFNLIKKTDYGSYYIEGDPVKLGSLKDHVRIAGLLVPRILLYGIQGIISIIVAIILFFTKAGPIYWFSYFGISNLFFIYLVIRDSISISNSIKQQSELDND